MSTADLVYRPDRVEFTPAWDTWLPVARSGNEPQRHAQRWAPRWTITYGYRMDEDGARRLRWLLNRRLGETWRVPVWWESTRITATTDSGPDIAGDFTAADLLQDDLAYILHKNGSSGEFFVLANVDTTSVTPEDPLGAVYPAGSRVFLAVEAHLRERQDIARWPVNLADVVVQVDVERHRHLGGATAALTLYRGLPLLDRLYVGRKHGEVHERGYSWFDGEGGKRQRVLGWDVPRVTYPRTLRLPTRAELQWGKLLLDTLKGRRGQLWAPTWTSDFALVGASPGASSFTVSDDPAGLPEEWSAATAERHVQVRRLDGGDPVRRRVTGVVDLGGATLRLDLEAPLPADLPGLDQLRCSLLELCRLDEDAPRFRFEAGLRAHLELVLRTVDEAATVTQYDENFLADSMTLGAGTVAEYINMPEGLADSQALSDSVSEFLNMPEGLAEAYSLDEAVADQQQMVEGVADSLSLSDAVAETLTFPEGLADSLALSDSLAETYTPGTIVEGVRFSMDRTGFVDVPGMEYRVVSGKRYSVHGMIAVQSDGTSNGYGIGWNGPVSFTRVTYGHAMPTALTALSVRANRDYRVGSAIASVDAANSDMPCWIVAEFVASANGYLRLCLKSENDASFVALETASWLEFKEIP